MRSNAATALTTANSKATVDQMKQAVFSGTGSDGKDVTFSNLTFYWDDGGYKISVCVKNAAGVNSCALIGYLGKSDTAKAAAKLSTSRTLWGQSFDGSGNVSGNMSGVGNISSNYYSLVNSSTNAYLSLTVGTATYYTQVYQGMMFLGPGVNAIKISSSSNVGIGFADSSTTPAYKLDVVGTIHATANICIDKNSIFNVVGFTGAAWGFGKGAYNVGIANNSSQTPLILAYREGLATRDGSIASLSGANRLFALELLNTGGTLAFNFAGSNKATLTSAGVFWASSVTNSDQRLKYDITPYSLDLTAIANAPSVSFRWRDNDLEDLGTIAQYWQRIDPRLTPISPFGMLGVQYGNLALLGLITVARKTVEIDLRMTDHERRLSLLEADRKRLEADNARLLQKVISLMQFVEIAKKYQHTQ